MVGGLFVAACGLLSSCGTWAPEHVGSVVVVCGLSCPAACGILVPRPGIEPTSSALEGGVLTTGPPGKSLFLSFEEEEKVTWGPQRKGRKEKRKNSAK